MAMTIFIALAALLSPVVISAYYFWYHRFANKHFTIDALKYPTLARLQKHLYVSNVKRRESEYKAKLSSIQSRTVEIDQKPLIDKKRQNRLELAQFDRQMNSMLGLPDFRYTAIKPVFGATYEPKVEVVKGGAIKVPISGTVNVREFPRFNAKQVGYFSNRKAPCDGYTIGEYVSYPTVSSDVWYYSKAIGGYFWGGVAPEGFHENLPYLDNPEGDSSNAVSSLDPRYTDPSFSLITAGVITADKIISGPIELSSNGLVVRSPNPWK